MSEGSQLRCDECGRGVEKIHRVHKDHRYCVTCYARVFKRRLCPKCGELARLPRNEPDAICRRCEVAKPCVRCGKTEYEIGKITSYGPVCNSCAPYFREPEPCEACGEPSQRLSRVRRLGHDLRLCPKCARSDYGTCAACRRHRQLNVARDGRKLCKVCIEEGEIPCPSCGKPMPAGRGSACEECYWAGTCRKRIRMDQAALSMATMKTAFGEFGEWLISEVGSHKAALTIHRYLAFFDEIERRWSEIPGYAELLEHYGAEGLRRVRIPMRWLREAKGIEPDPLAREACSERRRIEAIISSVPKSSRAGKALEAYHKELMVKVEAGKTSMKSVRLALRPAASLLLKSDSTGGKLPNQEAVDHYLTESPGQEASLKGFTIFLGRNYGIELCAKADRKRANEERRRKLEHQILDLAKLPENWEDQLEQWIALGMEYFHGKRISRKGVRLIRVQDEGKGMRIELGGEEFWLPKPNHEVPV